MNTASQYLERLLLTVWVGATWTVGYLVAPLLFRLLDDRMVAGQLMGEMFGLVHIIGAVCGGLLLLMAWAHFGRRTLYAWQMWVLVVMLLLIAIIELSIRPQMVEMKAQGLYSSAQFAAEFGRLHGISSVCYLVNSLLGLLLIMTGVRGVKPVA
ncbi:MAG: DUF4149 domain-containing protein [Gammaproteobacteria bacterium]|nr:DUF4149 domain-containing protein [Gammaproteobacteria bacterium]MCF6229599.1 DUF4149 domain-containing protein [Gammaproteobacteria bacterium]